MKKMNVFCVLVLALMLVDLVVDLFLNTRESGVKIDLSNTSLVADLFILSVVLASLGAVVAAIVYFVKFVLNVNRNQVFTERNVSLISKYGYCGLLCGVCTMLLTAYIGHGFWSAVVDGLDALVEGFFALLIAEVFSIGMSLQERKRTAA